MRPLLKDLEDEEGWMIDDSTKTIYSQIQSPNNTVNSESLLLRRRYADSYFNYSFQFDNVYSPCHTTEYIYKQSVKKLVK